MKKIDLSDLEKKINIEFKDKELLQRALTHRSYLNEHREFTGGHNERLEFLGDAILELSVTDYLYNFYPQKTEGELTSYRAALVNTFHLAEVAKRLKVGDYLLLSKGEARDIGRARQYILANTMESLIGAIYLDKGYGKADEFIKTEILSSAEETIKKNLSRDTKSRFQEKAQEIEGITPTYQVLEESGPDHNKNFLIGLYLDDKLIATGKGHSKQEAEQKAAQAGLKLKNWE
ncbi:MAG TPA: ribonuclease III [Candidatus Vogelbacteria bacterium]|nr:ribonuclease III [Candidatus Vogelbacteria bacterium]